jgi:hypothetical protein
LLFQKDYLSLDLWRMLLIRNKFSNCEYCLAFLEPQKVSHFPSRKYLCKLRQMYEWYAYKWRHVCFQMCLRLFLYSSEWCHKKSIGHLIAVYLKISSSSSPSPFVTSFTDDLQSTVKTVCNDQPWGTKKWPLLTGGWCSEVSCVMKVPNGNSKWWPLKTGGRYLEAVLKDWITSSLMEFIVRKNCQCW